MVGDAREKPVVMQQVSGSQSSATATPSTVRPKDAVISCAHFWAYALVLAGVSEFILGGILFHEWRGFGAFWAGAMAIGAGVAGFYVTRSEAAGGLATGFYMFLSVATLIVCAISITRADGLAFLVVEETEGNCVEAEDCPPDSCGEYDCVCWKPDDSLGCVGGDSLRYCFQFAGDRCSEIKDSENLLRGSAVVLMILACFSACSLVVSASTCWFCKRVMVVTSREPRRNNNEASSASLR